MRLTARGRLVLILACVTAFVVGLTLPATPWWMR